MLFAQLLEGLLALPSLRSGWGTRSVRGLFSASAQRDSATDEDGCHPAAAAGSIFDIRERRLGSVLYFEIIPIVPSHVSTN